MPPPFRHWELPSFAAIADKLDLQEWRRAGVLNLGGMFEWWWTRKVGDFEEASIADVIDLEFQMYQHHTKHDPRDKDDRTLRTMMYYECGFETIDVEILN